ncbi:ACP S-malonyltransferase [Aquihabitans sp. G128]|uniref:ACP S-malonyltransferase n=1 Tax=Aquihabitans sp. G128 TaxID=2849779 RepID=UPI001C250177|nr:ACP S-malonyltransferase [Aquihabitans sp. G128]QXC61467.1 ACP S-malonyltransferase [Aquihabitans sp. G128]
MGIAVVFPGQGSQAAQMGRPWRDHGSWSLVERATAATGAPLAHLLLEAPAEELAPTREAQLSVLTTSLVAWDALAATLDRREVVAVAGHSLGQITALVASGAVSAADGFRLAAARAEASAEAQAATGGAMLALLGADEDVAHQACRAAPDRAWVANVNGAGQVVVGGHADALDAVAERAKELGVRRTRRLAVDGAFHTPLMALAAERLAPVLDTVAFHPPAFPVVTNHDAAPVRSADGWPERLTTHLVSPVRWADVVAQLVAMGADTVIEVGPGTTLTGLVKRIAPDVTTRSVATPDDLPVEARR